MPIDAEAQLALYGGATEEALKEGFTGLRVAADVTALVGEPSMWDAHVAWEAVADRYMASMPLSAMCCYDRRELPKPDRLGPRVRPPGRPRRRRARQVSHLRGGAAKHRPARAARSTTSRRTTSTACWPWRCPAISSSVLDLSELDFIDQHGVMRIAKRVAETDGLRVRNVPAPTQRLCEPAGCRDMSAGALPCAHGDAFRHEALFYESDDAFLEGTLAFVRDGIEAGEPALVVVDSRKIELIRAELNGEAAKVSFLDMEEVGRNPARIIPLWRRVRRRGHRVGHRRQGHRRADLGGPQQRPSSRSASATSRC